MQVKNALRFHLNLVRMFKIKTINGDKYRIDVRKTESLISSVVNENCCRQCGNHWGFLKKNLKIDRAHNRIIPLIGVSHKSSIS